MGMGGVARMRRHGAVEVGRQVGQRDLAQALHQQGLGLAQAAGQRALHRLLDDAAVGMRGLGVGPGAPAGRKSALLRIPAIRSYHMKIAKDTAVTLSYKVADAQGKLVEQSNAPMVYLHGGYGNTLPKIEEALDGQEPGFQTVLAL